MTICIPQLASWLLYVFYLHVFFHRVYISIIKPWKSQKLWVTCELPGQFNHRRGIGLLHSDFCCVLPALTNRRPCWPERGRVRKMRETRVTTAVLLYCSPGGGRGRWRIFLSPPLRTSSRPIRMEKLESHITNLAGLHVLRSWPGIRLNESPL
jgi:hypothetical protein